MNLNQNDSFSMRKLMINGALTIRMLANATNSSGTYFVSGRLEFVCRLVEFPEDNTYLGKVEGICTGYALVQCGSD